MMKLETKPKVHKETVVYTVVHSIYYESRSDDYVGHLTGLNRFYTLYIALHGPTCIISTLEVEQSTSLNSTSQHIK